VHLNASAQSKTSNNNFHGLPHKIKSSKQNVQSNFVNKKQLKSSNRNMAGMNQKVHQRVRYSSMPPEMEIDHVRKIKRRYENSTLGTSTIDINALLNAHIMNATTTTAYSLFRAVRIHKIELWAPVLTQGLATEVSLTPISDGPSATNSFADLPITYEDSTISIDRPAYICFKPFKTETSGSWHLSIAQNDNLVDIIAPTGCVMDLTLEVIDNLTTVPLGYTVSTTATTVGRQSARAIGTFVPNVINVST
jgi:hypothetical protein